MGKIPATQVDVSRFASWGCGSIECQVGFGSGRRVPSDRRTARKMLPSWPCVPVRELLTNRPVVPFQPTLPFGALSLAYQTPIPARRLGRGRTERIQSKFTSAQAMHPALNRNAYLVKEHVGFLKAANNYDVFDPETGEEILQCREERLGLVTKLVRLFTDYKRMTPFNVQIRTPSGQPVVRVSRGISIFLSKVDVWDENEQRLGGFKQKLFSIGGSFTVLSKDDQPLCELKGKWTSWEFSFKAGNNELAKVSKKWAGIGKELFTSADNYILEISPQVPPDNAVRQLIIAAVMCIDMVLKE